MLSVPVCHIKRRKTQKVPRFSKKDIYGCLRMSKNEKPARSVKNV